MRTRILLLSLCCAVAVIRGAAAQTLEARVLSAPTDTIRMSYPAREGVCGNGRYYRFDDGLDGNWMGECEAGPVRVQIEKDGDRVTAIRAYVGGSWRPRADATDFGAVAALEASDWLLGMASTAAPSVAEDAIVSAVLADAPDPWPRLLELARDRSLAADVRESATFWLGQSAAREATRGLADMADSETENTEMQKAAVFALSQRDEPERIDHLIRIARTHADPEVVRSAFFWLADSADARAIDLFEDVLSIR